MEVRHGRISKGYIKMDAKKAKVFSLHDRTFQDNRYVYPVISRRSGGLSLGINLSLRKECNFDCVYCQVDRSKTDTDPFMQAAGVADKVVDLSILETELIELIELSISQKIYSHPRFIDTPKEYQVLQDIALSGDGEATTSKYFSEVSSLVYEVILRYLKKGVSIKPVVITNGTTLMKEKVRSVLLVFSQLGGGPWVKLDAGTEPEFQQIAETAIPYQTILDNIISFAKIQPIILQTIVYQKELSLSFDPILMVKRLLEMLSEGATFQYIQLYTLARKTRITNLGSLEEEELNNIANVISSNTKIPVKVYP